jgi:methyl-accepting chemotaxis protein
MDAVGAIGGVSQRIAAINDAVASIAAAVEEQGAATRGIAENVQLASTGAQAVSGNIREILKSAASSSRATRKFLVVTNKLANNAQRLRDDTENFLAQMQWG